MPKFALAALVAAFVIPRTLPAQGETTSAILGLVTDETGSGIPGADITAVSEENGQKRSLKADQAGRFAFPQLKPGSYTVEASAPQFRPQRKSAVAASLGHIQTVNFTLGVVSIRSEITVNSEAPLLNTENPNTSTTLNARAMEDLPNPGGDLTYPLQFAAGAVINTAGSSNDFVGGSNGFGNVEFNGLPALANGYIVDGLETNDPLTNLNSGLSTNLVLGLNSISEVTVNTLSYAVDQGRYGASQVNYITKSGTNQFHGNLYELWNGARFNAADFFTNSTPGNQKPRSTVNHFGGSVGGPVQRDKLFFFFDSEWVRIALPIVSAVTVPTPQLESYILQQLPIGGRDVVTGATYPAQPQLIPFYLRLFSLYSSASGVPVPVLGCPFTSGGSPAGGSPPNGDGCAMRRSVSQSSADHEQVQTGRVDYNAGTNDILWVRLQADTGLQAAYTDPINPVFDAVSSQPLYSFALGYTHVFSSHLVNYFNPAFSWFESLFGPANLQQTLAAFPIVLEGSGGSAPFSTLGGQDNAWIQGRRASRFFINDNLAWTAGAHDLRFGTNTRILRLNDYDFGEGTTPTVTYTDLPQFIYGVASTATTTFPLAYSQPFNFLNVDLYAQDTWKLTGKLTWTFGVRATHNSNPLNPHMALAQLPDAFDSPFTRRRSAARCPDSNACRQPFPCHARSALATAHGHRVGGGPRDCGAHRIRSLLRSAARKRCRSDCRQPALREYISRRPLGNGGRDRDSARSGGQRGGCERCGEPEFPPRIRRRAGILREFVFAGCRIRELACRLFRSPPYRAGNFVRRTLCSGVWRSSISLAPAPISRRSMWGRAR